MGWKMAQWLDACAVPAEELSVFIRQLPTAPDYSSNLCSPQACVRAHT